MQLFQLHFIKNIPIFAGLREILMSMWGWTTLRGARDWHLWIFPVWRCVTTNDFAVKYNSSSGNRKFMSEVPYDSASGLGLCQSSGILQRKCELQWTPARYHAGGDILDRCFLFVNWISQEHLFAENKEKLISAAILSLITKEGDQDNIPTGELEQQFHALRLEVVTLVPSIHFIQIFNLKAPCGKQGGLRLFYHLGGL